MADPTPEQVKETVLRVVRSRGFQNSERMIRFLQVFDGLPSYDPKLDTIVRVEARRLRKKLKEYYGEIGGKLNVASVLEGSVRKADHRFRITLQLIRTSDGTYLWSRTIEREVKDVFAVQDEYRSDPRFQALLSRMAPRSEGG